MVPGHLRRDAGEPSFALVAVRPRTPAESDFVDGEWGTLGDSLGELFVLMVTSPQLVERLSGDVRVVVNRVRLATDDPPR